MCVCVEMFAGLVSLVCEKNQHTKRVTADVQMDSTGLHVLMISLGKRNLFKLKLTAFTSTFSSAFVDEINAHVVESTYVYIFDNACYLFALRRVVA